MAAAKKKPGNSPLDKALTERLQKLQAAKVVSVADLPLLDFIVKVSPRFTRPEHLSSIVPYLEATNESAQYFCFSAPPRHGKSQLVFHYIARFIARYPHLNVAYCSYSATFAERKSVEIREICRRAGVEFDRTSNARDSWRTTAGGGLLARGPGGPLTGEGLHLAVIDDPYRSRAEAESGTIRENIMDWWTSVLMTRLEPGASVITTHTRWHMEDLIGRLVEDQQWPYINLPAINADGLPLWPERYDLTALARRRKEVGEYDWASMFMGEPRPRGGAVFDGTTTYTEEQFKKLEHDKLIARYAIGLDMAYTAKTHSDHSAAVVLAFDVDNNAYVRRVVRRQVEAPEFATVLKELRLTYNSPPIYWYASGLEKGFADFFRTRGIPIKVEVAKDDKFNRAQSAAAAWNAGKILVPSDHTQWNDAFVSEVLTFTGLDDKHDDMVDALAAAYIPATKKKLPRGLAGSPVLPF